MARVLGVSESGFHAWRRRPASAHARADAALLKRVRTIHVGSRATYGVPRVHAALRAEGDRHGRKRIARLMRQAGLVGASRRRSSVTTTRRDPEGRPAPDLVDRDFAAAGANQLRKEAGVRPSIGSVCDAYDNAMCESFFATLECELLDRRRFASQAEARMARFSFSFIEEPNSCQLAPSDIGSPTVSRSGQRFDQFWFTVFHDLGHLLLHDGHTFVDDEDTLQDGHEQEANAFARDCIVPEERRAEFERLSGALLPVAKGVFGDGHADPEVVAQFVEHQLETGARSRPIARAVEEEPGP